MGASTAFRALGTTAALHVTEAAGLRAAREILVDELAAIDLACSRFRPDSELSRVNAAGGRAVAVSDLLCEAVEAGLRAARVSDGAVDPTLGRALRGLGYDRDLPLIAGRVGRPRTIRVRSVAGWRSVGVDRSSGTVRVPAGIELDLGATAKALAADRAARRAWESVGGGVLVNLGGDLAIAGAPPEGAWRVLVTDDHSDPSPGAGQTVSVAGGGLATSSTTVRRWATADGERHHIVDPATGDSAVAVWRTASVAAGSCVDANVAATAAIVRGAGAPAWLAERRLPSRLVHADGSVVCVGGWPAAQEAVGGP